MKRDVEEQSFLSKEKTQWQCLSLTCVLKITHHTSFRPRRVYSRSTISSPGIFACISDNQPRMTLSVDVQKRCKVVCSACFLGKFFVNLCCRRQILLSTWIHKDIFDWQHSGHSNYKILATKTDRVDNSPGQAWREREFCHLATEGGNISTPVKEKRNKIRQQQEIINPLTLIKTSNAALSLWTKSFNYLL